MNRNRNFCKETQVSKIIARAKVDARAVPLKKSTGFSRRSVTPNLQCVGALLRNNKLMDAFSLCIVTYIIDMLTREHLNLSLDCHVSVPLRKNSSLLSDFFISRCFTFLMHRSESDSLMF